MKRTTWKFTRELVAMDDFIRIYDEHPEWHGKDTTELLSIPGGIQFYRALISFARIKAGKDDQKRRKIINKVLHTDKSHRDWLNFMDIKEWARYYRSRKDWQNQSMRSLIKVENDRDFAAFYAALGRFTKKNCTPELYPKKMKEIVFGEGYENRYRN